MSAGTQIRNSSVRNFTEIREHAEQKPRMTVADQGDEFDRVGAAIGQCKKGRGKIATGQHLDGALPAGHFDDRDVCADACQETGNAKSQRALRRDHQDRISEPFRPNPTRPRSHPTVSNNTWNGTKASPQRVEARRIGSSPSPEQTRSTGLIKIQRLLMQRDVTCGRLLNAAHQRQNYGQAHNHIDK